MTHPAYDIRFALIALGALALTLSFGGDAAGQTATSRSRKAAGSCCSSRVCPMGCCAPRPAATHSLADQSASIPALSTGQIRPGSSCECQSDEPVAPASRQDLRTAGNRFAEELSDVALLPIPQTYPGQVARLIEPDPWPARSPLYLATSRLRI